MAIIPFGLIVLFFYYKISVGDYSLGGYYDPAYAYIFNSLNLSQLKGLGVGHVEHPGTTVQIVGGIILRSVYFFSGREDDIVVDFLKRPEYYVSIIVYTFVIIIAFCDYILGLCILLRLKNIYMSLVFQVIPLFSPTIYDHISDISSESLLIPSVLIFLAFIFTYPPEINSAAKKNKYSILILGLISGFGLATKLTFFPLMVIPLIVLRKLKVKLLYLMCTAVFFIFFVSPAFSSSNTERFSVWISSIVMHSGQYGRGSENVIEGTLFLRNMLNIFEYELHFTWIYLILMAVLFLKLVPKFRVRLKNDNFYILTLGIFLSMTLYIIVIAKHFNFHYLIPAYMLCIPGLISALLFTAKITPAIYLRRASFTVYIIIACLTGFQLNHVFIEFKFYSIFRDEMLNIENFRNLNYPNSPYIRGTKLSKEFSLYYGSWLSGKGDREYLPVIKRLYPDYIYFDTDSNRFYNTDIERLKTTVQNSDRLVFRTDSLKDVESLENNLRSLVELKKLVVNEVFRNEKGEMLFEIIPSK